MVKDEKVSAEQTVRDIRRQTRRKYNTEEKIRIVVEGLRGEASVAELCRREGINPNLYYKWSKEFLEAGKARLAGDTKRQATSDEVSDIRRENEQLKQVVAELLLKNRALKKSALGGETSVRSSRGASLTKYRGTIAVTASRSVSPASRR